MNALLSHHGGDRPVAAERSHSALAKEAGTVVDHLRCPDDLAPARGIAVSILLGLSLWAIAAVTAWYLL